MNTLKIIERTLNCVDSKGIPRGWVIYYDKNDRIKEIKSLLREVVEVLSEKYVPSNYNYDTTNATVNLWNDNEKVQNN